MAVTYFVTVTDWTERKAREVAAGLAREYGATINGEAA